jgi:hypothetical protein
VATISSDPTEPSPSDGKRAYGGAPPPPQGRGGNRSPQRQKILSERRALRGCDLGRCATSRATPREHARHTTKFVRNMHQRICNVLATQRLHVVVIVVVIVVEPRPSQPRPAVEVGVEQHAVSELSTSTDTARGHTSTGRPGRAQHVGRARGQQCRRGTPARAQQPTPSTRPSRAAGRVNGTGPRHCSHRAAGQRRDQWGGRGRATWTGGTWTGGSSARTIEAPGNDLATTH